MSANINALFAIIDRLTGADVAAAEGETLLTALARLVLRARTCPLGGSVATVPTALLEQARDLVADALDRRGGKAGADVRKAAGRTF